MITLLAVFSLEHLFMCIPIFILCHRIKLRNIYLETLYGQLPEEKVSLKYQLFIAISSLYSFKYFESEEFHP